MFQPDGSAPEFFFEPVAFHPGISYDRLGDADKYFCSIYMIGRPQNMHLEHDPGFVLILPLTLERWLVLPEFLEV